MLFVFVFIALAGFDSALSCSRDRARQCEETLLRSIQRHIANKAEMTSHCMNVREDFNCLLEETRCLTTETERNQKGNSLRNALNYIRDGCDTLGGSWRDSSCYISERMKACENSHPLGGSQYSIYNPETCRKFKLFEDCVKETVRSRCRSQDEKLLGQYLVESAQDLAWNCGEPTKSSSSDWDRTRGDYDRDRYDPSDRDRVSSRDRDRDRDFDRTRDYDRNRDQNRDRDRPGERDRYNDRYNDRNGSGYDRSGSGYDRNGGGYDRNGGGYDRNGGGYDRSYGNSDITCCRNERCSSSRMAQCRDSLSRTIESRSSGYQDLQKCRKARDDFNCLLWQTSNCQSRNDRDRDNDIFRKAKDYISRNCDTYGRWSENSCYKSTEMERCETTLPSTRGGANYESCRAYNNFKDCMLDELQRRCTREDELFQGAYLVDKAQELSWMCGGDQYSGNGRNQYFTDNRRDPYDTNDGYVDSPQHLNDDDAMCLSRIQAYNEKCKAAMDEKKRDIYITNEYEARQKINCCAIREYRSCLYDATRRVCQTDRSNVVDNLMGRYTYELSSDNCRRIYDSDCNSASNYGISTLLLILCSLILFF